MLLTAEYQLAQRVMVLDATTFLEVKDCLSIDTNTLMAVVYDKVDGQVVVINDRAMVKDYDHPVMLIFFQYPDDDNWVGHQVELLDKEREAKCLEPGLWSVMELPTNDEWARNLSPEQLLALKIEAGVKE